VDRGGFCEDWDGFCALMDGIWDLKDGDCENPVEIVFSQGGFCAESPSDSLLQPCGIPADHGVVFVLTHIASLLECPAWS
jgi:hypothetical protein